MSWIAGFDISTNAIDCVMVPQDAGDWLSGPKVPTWLHFPLNGPDAWERTRRVSVVVPGRGWWKDEGLYAAGIEVPFGFSSAKVSMIVGALLNRLPEDILIERWPHNSWRKAMGLKGGGKSEVLKQEAVDYSRLRSGSFYTEHPFDTDQWSVDAHEAHLIALATRAAVETSAAA